MNVSELLLDLYGRIPPLVREAVDELDPTQLTHRISSDANPIGWLVWHLTRVMDGHLAEIIDEPQIWMDPGIAGRFGLDPDPTNHGYGHTTDDVAAVQPDGVDALLDYFDLVDGRTRAFLATLTPADLDRIVDEGWDPPVTLGVRLVSIADDCLQHVGQANYLRGLAD